MNTIDVKMTGIATQLLPDPTTPGFRSSIAAVLALVTWVTLGASSSAEAAIMEVEAIGTIDYYHDAALVRSEVIPTVSYFDTLGSEVPNQLLSPAYLAGNKLDYQGGNSNFYNLTFAVAGFAVFATWEDWPGFGTPNLITGQGATPAFLNFNRISQAEFSSLQDPWAAVFNGATFGARDAFGSVFYDGVWSTGGDPGRVPDGISISFYGSIHEVPEPPLTVLMALGLLALWAHRGHPAIHVRSLNSLRA
jgi:hypothetical protein